MATKEKILGMYDTIDNQFEYYEPDVLRAMDEYAKQECIDFAKWITVAGENYWGVDGWDSGGTTLSTAQLYDKYIKQKQNNG